MKIRADILRIYKDVHTWTGIIAGLALFVAFYAGALTVFKHDLAAWVAAPTPETRAVDIGQAGQLIEQTLQARPEAARKLILTLRATDAQPGVLSWKNPEGTRQYLSTFDSSGKLQITEREPTAVADLIDNLHRTAGFVPGDLELGVLVIGVIAMLYGLALVSGLIILLPTLVKDMFALRLGKNLKLMWKDAHNAIGLFSLPFHIVIALTTVVFAFHDQIYDIQEALIYEGRMIEQWTMPAPPIAAPSLAAKRPEPHADATTRRIVAPSAILADLRTLSPGFKPDYMQYYDLGGKRPRVWVHGTDANYMMRYDGFAILDPYTGEIINGSYLPGHTHGWTSWLAVFFALHFATFGGATVQWIYFLLAIAGAFLFYSGNLLWIESRRRRAIKHGIPEQKTSVRVMSALTVGVCLGCIAGVSASLAAGKWLHGLVDNLNTWHVVVYYAVFFLSIAWAFKRGAARAAVELLWACAAATAAIPLTSLLGVLLPFTGLWANMSPSSIGVDIGALVGATCLSWMAIATSRRQRHGQADSVWALARA
jgi:uncharacterized iron-regulated membrane protein